MELVPTQVTEYGQIEYLEAKTNEAQSVDRWSWEIWAIGFSGLGKFCYSGFA